MTKMLVVVLLLGTAFNCNAQDEYVIVGKVLEGGTVQQGVSKIDLLHAIGSVHSMPVRQEAIWYQVKFSEGPRRYLVCDVDTFIIAFECRQVGDNIIIHSDGITHIGTPDKCLNPGFLFADDG